MMGVKSWTRALAALAAALSASAVSGAVVAQPDVVEQLERLPAVGGQEAVEYLGYMPLYREVVQEAEDIWLTPGRTEERGLLLAWLTVDPALGGERRLIAFYSDHTQRQPRVSAERITFTGSDLASLMTRTYPLEEVRAAFAAHVRNGQIAAEWPAARARLLPEPRSVARSLRVRRQRADERSCPALRVALQEAERLPLPSPVLFPNRSTPADDVVIMADGASVTLNLPTEQRVGSGGRESVHFGRMALSGNVDTPVAAWAARLERETRSCWRSAAPS